MKIMGKINFWVLKIILIVKGEICFILMGIDLFDNKLCFLFEVILMCLMICKIIFVLVFIVFLFSLVVNYGVIEEVIFDLLSFLVVDLIDIVLFLRSYCFGSICVMSILLMGIW